MDMRKSILPFVVLAAATVWAEQPSQSDPSRGAKTYATEEAPKSELQGDVVSTESEAKILKLKVQAAAETTTELALSVEGDAVAALGELKAGNRVTVTCREGTSGDACVVTAIKKTEPKP